MWKHMDIKRCGLDLKIGVGFKNRASWVQPRIGQIFKDFQWILTGFHVVSHDFHAVYIFPIDSDRCSCIFS